MLIVERLPAVNGGNTPAQRKAHNLRVALFYARHGVPVLPLRDKVPMVCLFTEHDTAIPTDRREARRARFVDDHGFEPLGIGSTTDEATIRRWWASTPHELAAGISPGLVGAIVCDTDNKQGDNPDAALLRTLLAEHGHALDPAVVPMVLSGRNEGRHLWFANPEELGCGKAAAIGADWKGMGGQVVAPGCLLPPAKGGDGRTRHYQPAPGSLDLVAAISGGTLPVLPACLRALHGGKTGAAPKPEFPALQAEVEAGPEQDIPPTDVEALIADVRDPAKGIGDLWDQPSPDHSDNRWKLAQALRRRRSDRAVTVHHYAALLEAWDGAGSFSDYRGQGLFSPYDIAREWGKNATVTAASDGAAFGAVVDEEPAPTAMDGPGAFAALVGAVPFDEDTAEPEAALRRAIGEDRLKRAQAARLDALLGGIRAGTWRELPRSFDELRRAVLEPPRRMRRLADIVAREPARVEWLIAGMLTVGEMVVSAGAPAAGKSVDKLHMALCIANGAPYHGHATRKAGVLFVGAENAGEDERRINANMKHHGGEADGQLVRDSAAAFFHRPALARLYDPNGAVTQDERDIIADALSIEAETGFRCKLIVFDNLRRLIVPGSTNDEVHVSIVVKALERIRDATGATIDVIAHTIRDGTRFAGSGAIESSVDSLWHYTGPTKGKAGSIEFAKMRLGDKSRSLSYAFTSAVVAHDTDGQPVRTVVAVDELRGAGKAVDGAAFGDVSDQLDEEQPAADMGTSVVEDGPAERAQMMGQAAQEISATRPSFAARDLYAATNGMRQGAGLKPLGPTTLDVAREPLIRSGALRVEGFGRSRLYVFAFTNPAELTLAPGIFLE